MFDPLDPRRPQDAVLLRDASKRFRPRPGMITTITLDRMGNEVDRINVIGGVGMPLQGRITFLIRD